VAWRSPGTCCSGEWGKRDLMRSPAPSATALAILLALAPSVSAAHVGVQTVELLAGALHPWINLESGLVLCALTLWLTQCARSTDVAPFVVTSACVAAGVAIGWWLRVQDPSWLIYLVAFVAGGCVTCNFVLSPLARLAIVGSMALLASYSAGVDAASDIKNPVFFIMGALVGSLVIFLSFAALFVERDSRAVRIGFRILGSWIAAISLMLFALKLRG
jgi:hydrogenase/urease accessory protein HupE